MNRLLPYLLGNDGLSPNTEDSPSQEGGSSFHMLRWVGRGIHGGKLEVLQIVSQAYFQATMLVQSGKILNTQNKTAQAWAMQLLIRLSFCFRGVDILVGHFKSFCAMNKINKTVQSRAQTQSGKNSLEFTERVQICFLTSYAPYCCKSY